MKKTLNEPAIITVILIDDHQVVRAGIRTYLESSPRIKVIAEGADGNQALDLVHQLKPDVLVMDIQMPGLTGIGATRQLRSRGEDVAILILTAYDDRPYIQALLKAGANGYMLKTAEAQEIIQAVEGVYSGKISIDPDLMAGLGLDEKAKMDKGGDLFSDREMEILKLVAEGLTNKAIARTLGISSRTVQNHLANMFKKADCSSRTELISLSTRLKLLQPEFDQHKPGVNL